MRILVCDDEKNIRENIAEYLGLEGVETLQAQNGLAAQKLLTEQQVDGAVVDLKMPGMNGLELLEWIRREGPDVPVIMISAFGDIEDAVNAMKKGAADYIVKPFDPDDLLLRVRRAVEDRELRARAAAWQEAEGVTESASPVMRDVYRLAGKVAPTDSTVLITGESGTGKEVLARHIHELSPRAPRPFFPINIGGLPETLIESELFGYERGAFTGAEQRKRGMMELASSGTLFLDEIGDMPLHLQVKLLRVLQDRKIQRLGGTGVIPVDVRIIAATNADLEQRVASGRFREDLFYRLNIIRIELPPLRARRDDIPRLAGHFVRKMSSRTGSSVAGITPGAIRLLQSYRFPGNVRELENIIERAVILSETSELSENDFASLSAQSRRVEVPQGTLRELERLAILEALRRNEGRRIAAASELGISRRTLLNKIKEYDMEGQF